MRRVGLILVGALLVGGCSAKPVGGLEWERVDDPVFGERSMSEDGERPFMLAVASSGSLLVAVGSEGSSEVDAAVWVSADGREWEQVEVPAPADPYSPEQMRGVVSVGSGFVAHGWAESIRDSAVWFSIDGYQWQRLPSSSFGAPEDEVEINAMVAGGPGLVAVGTAWHPDLGGRIGAIWVSETGRSWKRIAHDDEVLGERGDLTQESAGSLWWVVPFDGGLVVLGRINGEMSLLRSPDGYTWERVPLGDSPFGESWGLNAMVAGGPGLVAVGSVIDITDDGRDSDAAIWVSPDGITWERVAHDERLFGGAECQGVKTVVAGGPGLVAFGGTDPCNRNLLPEAPNRVWVSTDGYTWERVPHDNHLFGDGSLGFLQAINGAVVHNGNIIAVGQWLSPTFLDESPPPDHGNVDDLSFGGRVWIATPVDD